jgi:short-subunit dehydrogenase
MNRKTLPSNPLVVVTGGSSGIGRQIAADFLRQGARVIVVSENAARVAQTTRELTAIAERIDGIVCDVGSRDEVSRLPETVFNRRGCPDILVNCAGFATYRTFEESDLEEIERLVNVNLIGAMRCAKAFLPAMIDRRSGAIVNMASVAGRVVITPNGIYSSAKHALVAWSEALRYELDGFGIQVNVICPGRVDTAFFDHETFRTRLPRAETRFSITAQDVSRATLQAIRRDRFITYVPWAFGPLVWLSEVAPFIAKPLLGRLMISRVKSLYAARPTTRSQTTD